MKAPQYRPRQGASNRWIDFVLAAVSYIANIRQQSGRRVSVLRGEVLAAGKCTRHQMGPLTPLARIVAHADWVSGIARPETPESPQVSAFPTPALRYIWCANRLGSGLEYPGSRFGKMTVLDL
jgi:hypothetical protein